MEFESFTRSLTGSREAPVLAFARTYRATPAELWSALTDPERLARWIGRVVPGADAGAFVVVFADAPDDPADALVEVCDPPERLALRWRWQDEPPSRIEVSLVPASGGTVLTLVHTLGEPDHVAGYGGGWEQCLVALTELFGAPAAATADVEAAARSRWHDLAVRALELTFDLPAAPETVWRAFTTVEGLKAWWWNHWPDVEIAVDARAGGAYRFDAPDAGIAVEGEFLEVEPSAHLAFTWRWIDADGVSRDEACDLRFGPIEAGTRLVLRHTGPWADDAPAESYRQGWEFTLGALTRTLAALAKGRVSG